MMPAVAQCSACGTALMEGANFCFHCGAPQEKREADDPLIGKMIGAYRVISVIGEGAMGRVYRAEQTTLRRAVCIKTIKQHLASDPSMIDRFEREARAVSSIRHPNIVGVLDAGSVPSGIFYIVMELIEGRSLSRLIQEDSPIPVTRALNLTEQILSALEEAHGAGIVHRDLKPQNVLVGTLRDGSDLAKVVDFGLAKLLHPDASDRRITKTGALFGTPGYMAPEQIMGEEIDGRADVYAAGTILYELLTGSRPFTGTLQFLLKAQLTEIPESPSIRAKGLPIPRELDAIVLRALEKAPERRYRSALDLKKELEAFRTGSSRRSNATIDVPPRGRASDVHAARLSTDLLRGMVPESIASHISDLESLVAGERRTITVLYGEVGGLSALSKELPRQEVRSIVEQLYGSITEIARSHGGLVDKLMSDFVTVIFGAPVAREDDPLRAVRSALAMLSALKELNKRQKRPLTLRIGLATGEAIVAAGESYDVSGDAVNVAKRISGHLASTMVAIDGATERALASRLKARPLAPVLAPEEREPIAVFEVEGITGEGRASASPLIGRLEEAHSIQSALQSAKRGRASGLLFIGDAGLGKTRLCVEAERLARASSVRTAHGAGGRSSLPLDLIRQALVSLSGKEGETVDKVFDALATIGAGAADLARLKSIFGGALRTQAIDADESKLLDRAAIIRVFIEACAKDALCLVLDDLHLADQPSLEILEEVIARTSASRFALVCAARPGDVERLPRGLRRIELAPLPPDHVLEIARLDLGGGELPDEVKDLVATRADGNPWVAEQLARSLADGGMMKLRGGSWAKTEGFDPRVVPDNAGLLVRSRFDTLSPDAKRLLRFGAVCGQSFSVDLVVSAVEAPLELERALRECEGRGFITRSSPARTMEFAQASVRDAVLAGLSKPDERHLHLRIADAIAHGNSPGDEHPTEALARHYLAGDQPRKAAEYSIAVGDRLLERCHFPQAAEHYDRALEIVSRDVERMTPVSKEAAQRVFELAARAIEARSMTAADTAVGIIDRVMRLAPGTAAPSATSDALRQHGRALLKLGRVHPAEQAFRSAVEHATQDVERTAEARADLAAAFEARGDYAAASKELLEAMRSIAGGRSKKALFVWRMLNQLGRIHARLGDRARAKEFFESARQHAERIESPVGESKAMTNLASMTAEDGDHARAETMFAQAMQLAEEAGDRIGVARIHYNLGRLLLRAGDRAAAAKRFEQSRDFSRELGWREGLASAVQALDALKNGPG
jgi:serine/threonine protein kinase/tetratricopeptide (TPR) repeat protein